MCSGVSGDAFFATEKQAVEDVSGGDADDDGATDGNVDDDGDGGVDDDNDDDGVDDTDREGVGFGIVIIVAVESLGTDGTVSVAVAGHGSDCSPLLSGPLQVVIE